MSDTQTTARLIEISKQAEHRRAKVGDKFNADDFFAEIKATYPDTRSLDETIQNDSKNEAKILVAGAKSHQAIMESLSERFSKACGVDISADKIGSVFDIYVDKPEPVETIVVAGDVNVYSASSGEADSQNPSEVNEKVADAARDTKNSDKKDNKDDNPALAKAEKAIEKQQKTESAKKGFFDKIGDAVKSGIEAVKEGARQFKNGAKENPVEATIMIVTTVAPVGLIGKGVWIAGKTLFTVAKGANAVAKGVKLGTEATNLGIRGLEAGGQISKGMKAVDKAGDVATVARESKAVQSNIQTLKNVAKDIASEVKYEIRDEALWQAGEAVANKVSDEVEEKIAEIATQKIAQSMGL